jgi:hypothetical protein
VAKIVVFQLVPGFVGSLVILLPLFAEATDIMGGYGRKETAYIDALFR